jgi:hypothetical protein
MKHLIVFFTIFSFGSNCFAQIDKDVINKAIKNQPELAAVINHYKKEGNQDKLQAAYFLIGNIDKKGTALIDLVDGQGVPVDFNISNFKDEGTQKKWLDSVVKVRGKLQEKIVFIADSKYITSQFLIENIDGAFDVKQKSPFCRDLSNEDFYEYILPYRVDTEKLESWRKAIVNDFSQMQKDSIYNFTTVLAAARYIDNIYQKRFKFGGNRYFNQKKVRSYSELLADKEGKCDDMCNLVVLALRALGIPSGFDGIPYKRASNDVGHSWCFVLDTKKQKKYPFDALSNNGPGFFNLPYKNAPKVYRKQFAVMRNNSIKSENNFIHPVFFENNALDVTSEYFETENIGIQLEERYQEPIYLCIWKNNWWRPVSYSYNSNESTAIFKDVAKDNLYCLAKYRYSALQELKEPFIVNKFGEVIYLSSIQSKKVINLNDYVNKELRNAKKDVKILEFETNREICQKVIQESQKVNEWTVISNAVLTTNTLYHFIDESSNLRKIFILKNDGSVDWY